MSSRTTARIFEFPAERTNRANRQASGSDQDMEILMVENGCLARDSAAIDMNFEIDEQDPLLMCRERAFDPSPMQRDLDVFDGNRQGDRFMRLKDLHPMDIAIVVGFVILGILI